MAFSQKLLKHRIAKNPAALQRIDLAKQRIQSILDREIVSHQKTLEQKISDQGPKGQHVDPHLVGLAVMDLLALKRLKESNHPTTGPFPWYSNILANDDAIKTRLDQLAPLYASVSTGHFPNLSGDALEVVIFKCLDEIYSNSPKHAYLGAFDLDEPKNEQGRFKKIQPPKQIGQFSTVKEADFIQFGHESGPLCIECKNYRQWLYPHEEYIKELIFKAAKLNAIPLLVARRVHYSTITNFLEPAGIIFHESIFQYYPSDKADLAKQVSDKTLLGFTDVRATEDPHPHTRHFFQNILPGLVATVAPLWQKNREALVAYANDEMNLAQLYTAIGSPAGGKWLENENWGIEPEP